jgi:adenylate kinase
LNTQRKIIIFIGPPGAGKGSLSNLCVERLSWVQLSTGNLCRKHIAEKTKIGIAIDEAIKAGGLVSDELIISMVDDWLTTQQANTILDGYPRTVVQARALKNLVSTKLTASDLAIVRLSISNEKVVARLSARMVCSNKDCQAVYSAIKGSLLEPNNITKCNKCDASLMRRPDDEPAAIQERLKTYYKHEKDLIDYYLKAGLNVKELPVERPLHDIFNELKTVIGQH